MPHKSMWKKDLSRVLIIVGIFVAALLVLRWLAQERLFDIEYWREWLHPDDSPVKAFRSSVAFVFVGALLVGLGMPRLWISAAGGGIFGAFLGTILALASTVLGSLITYIAGRSLLGSLVRRRLGKYPRFARIQAHLARNAFLYTLSMRLFPFSNTTVTSLFCGSCKVPILPYFSATLLGFLPLTAVFAMFGSGAAKARMEQMLLGVILLLVVALVQRRMASRFGGDQRDTPDPDGAVVAESGE